jgi:hypothetical protein
VIGVSVSGPRPAMPEAGSWASFQAQLRAGPAEEQVGPHLKKMRSMWAHRIFLSFAGGSQPLVARIASLYLPRQRGRVADRRPQPTALPGFREATARPAVAGEPPAGGMTSPAQAVLAVALAAILSTPAPQPDTFSNIPPTLSGASPARHVLPLSSTARMATVARVTDEGVPSWAGGDGKAERIKHPRSAKALQCTTKCVGTCIRGGGGAPGEGPLNVRR